MELRDFPGGELIDRGLTDLRAGRESVESLAVVVAAPRLRRLGFAVPASPASPEHRLYERLATADPTRAHSRYNALLRRLSSFCRSVRCGR